MLPLMLLLEPTVCCLFIMVVFYAQWLAGDELGPRRLRQDSDLTCLCGLNPPSRWTGLLCKPRQPQRQTEWRAAQEPRRGQLEPVNPNYLSRRLRLQLPHPGPAADDDDVCGEGGDGGGDIGGGGGDEDD